jgi:hypothetical protein
VPSARKRACARNICSRFGNNNASIAELFSQPCRVPLGYAREAAVRQERRSALSLHLYECRVGDGDTTNACGPPGAHGGDVLAASAAPGRSCRPGSTRPPNINMPPQEVVVSAPPALHSCVRGWEAGLGNAGRWLRHARGETLANTLLAMAYGAEFISILTCWSYSMFDGSLNTISCDMAGGFAAFQCLAEGVLRQGCS